MLLEMEVGDAYNDMQFKIVDEKKENLMKYAEKVAKEIHESVDMVYLSLESRYKDQAIIRYYHNAMKKTVSVYICTVK